MVQASLDARFRALGLNATEVEEDSPAALGIKLAEKVMNTGKVDVRGLELSARFSRLTPFIVALGLE